jgi:hypothetical protein
MPKHLTTESRAEVKELSPPNPAIITLVADSNNDVKGYMDSVIPDYFVGDNNLITAKGLSIGQGVTSIGSDAFYGCSQLTGNLVIPDGVTSIGIKAFRDCDKLTGNLVIPASVTTIGSQAFLDCGALSGDLVIPAGVTTIGNQAFLGCSLLTTVNCYVVKTIIDASSDCFTDSGIMTINVRTDDNSWGAGGPQTVGGRTVIVNKIL